MWHLVWRVPISYAAARALFAADESIRWTAYLIGVPLVSALEKAIPLHRVSTGQTGAEWYCFQ